MSHQRNDTRYTKIFVGGLAWETQRETMKMYFEQFGEILEAVVITDKNTGRSKGYGFVTFKEAEAAYRACQNPSPVIDGRRANCNLAALGAQKSQNGGGSTGRFRGATSMGAANPFTGSSSSYFPHSSSPQFPFSYSTYGYSGYSHDTIYPMSYYGMYGQQFSPFYPSGAVATTAATATATVPPTGYFPNMYQYYGPYAQSSYHGHGYGVQYPTHMHQIYPFLPHHLASTPLPISSSLPISSGTQGATMTIGIAGSTSMPGPSQSTPRPVSEQNSTA